MRRRYAAYPVDFLLPTFLDNHDMSRFLFLCRGDTAKLRAAARLQLRLPQPAVIFYGTETGLSHETPVDVARPGSDLQARRPMNWERPDRGLRAFYRSAIRRRRAAQGIRIP
jgi:glycosidase